MQNSIKLILLLLLLPTLLPAQLNLVNYGGTILKVGTGVDVRVEQGAIRNDNSSTIDNQGNIYLDGQFNQINSATYSGGPTSWLWFEGTTNQNLTGDAPLSIDRLRVDNGNLLVLGNDVSSTDVDLMNNGSIQLGAFDLIVNATGTISNYDAANYIITNSTGYLQQAVAASAVTFPIGNSLYNPATLSNAGTSDNFQARVEDQVLDTYPVGNVETDGVVSKAWFIEEQTLGGSDVTMTLQWETVDELPSFDRLLSGITHWTGSSWDPSPTWTTATNVGGTSWTQSRSNITTFSPFAIEDFSMDLPVELLAFTANRISNDKVKLDWQTASELNNKGFYIERMRAHETSFSRIGWVDGFGNTNVIKQYTYTDANAFPDVTYYRLRQVDFDDSETLSAVRAVEGIPSNTFGDVTIYPVPVTDALTLRFGELPKGVETGEIRVMDVQGRVIYKTTVSLDSHQLLLIEEVSQWAAAMYLLQVQLDNGAHLHKKFVKKK